jgi:1-deoxy-D-xylulose-5-phosphate reductoisomerase
MKAQMGLPDMRLPIQYALAFPQRIQNDLPRFDFLQYPSLTFETVDTQVFKNLDLAYQVMEKGGSAPCVLNATNEMTNELFRKGKIGFTDIADWNEKAIASLPFYPKPSLEDLIEIDAEARRFIIERV